MYSGGQMRGLSKSSISAVAAVLFFSVSCLAGTFNNTSEFLRIVPDPQSVAMGETIMAFPESPMGMVSNPAGMSIVRRPEVSFSETLMWEGMRHYFLGAVMPTQMGNIGAGVAHMAYGDIPGFDNNGDPYDISSSYATTFLLNYSIPVNRHVPVLVEYGSVGFNFKFIQDKLSEYPLEGMAFDLSAVVKMPFVKSFSASFLYKNMGSSMKFVNDTYQLPASLNYGVRYDLPWMTLVADSSNDAESSLSSYSAGFTVYPAHSIRLMSGWRESADSLNSGFRFGLGFDFESFTVNYAMLPSNDAAISHQAAIEIPLGPIPQQEAAYKRSLGYYFEKAKEKYYRRDYIAARQIIEDILAVYPGHRPSIEYLEKIGEKLDAIDRSKTPEANALLARADAELEAENIPEAKKNYDKVLEIFPGHPAALDGLARIDQIMGGYNDEKGFKDRAEAKRLFQKALVLYRKDRLVESWDIFLNILELDPFNAEAREYVKDINNRFTTLTKWETKNIFKSGVRLYKKNRFAESIKYFNAVLAADSKNAQAQEYIARAQEGVSQLPPMDPAESVKYEKELLAVKEKANKKYLKGDYQASLNLFAEAMKIAEERQLEVYVPGLNNSMAKVRSVLSDQLCVAADTSFQKDKLEDAAKSYEKALELNPDNSTAKAGLDKVSIKLSKYYYDRGMEAYSKSESDKAREYFEKSLKLYPGNEESKRMYEKLK